MPGKNVDAPTLRNELQYFTGDSERWRHPLCRKLIYTPGVRHLAERAGAYWLLDAIASWLPSQQFTLLLSVIRGFAISISGSSQSPTIVQPFSRRLPTPTRSRSFGKRSSTRISRWRPSIFIVLSTDRIGLSCCRASIRR